jgi:hypothetical protein
MAYHEISAIATEISSLATGWSHRRTAVAALRGDPVNYGSVLGRSWRLSATDLAERWVLFYWPLVDSREFIPQINGESTGGKPIAFRSALSELVGHFSRQGGLNGFARVKADRLLSVEEQRLYGRVLRIVSNTIVKGARQICGRRPGRAGVRV